MIGRYEIGSKMRINMNAFLHLAKLKAFWRYKKYLGIDLFNSTISRMSEHYIQIFALIFHRWWRCTIFDKKSTSKRDYKNVLVLSNVLCQFIYLALSINSIDISIRNGYILYIWLRYIGCNIIFQMWWCLFPI